MSSSAEERTAVKTYVPAYQKEHWKEHAEELDMSLSEFVRSMVQAGRSGFEGDDSADSGEADEVPGEEPGSPGATPGVEDVRTVVLDALREEPRSVDDLVDAVVGDLRDDVYDAVEALQADGSIQHDPRTGGYTVVADE